MNIAFLGSSENSLIVLRELHSRYPISLVVTTPPRPTGRQQRLTKTPVQHFAEKQKLTCLTPESLDSHFTTQFQATNPDLAVVADYRLLIPAPILNTPKYGCLNLHPSLLPRYRGSTPAQTAILMGDKVTGLTIIKMTEQFDRGPILAFFKEKIKDSDTAETLYRRLFEAGAEVLTAILPDWISGNLVPAPQAANFASQALRLTRADGFIPWENLQKAMAGKEIDPRQRPLRMVMARGTWPQIIERTIRAYHPWPGIWTTVETTKGQQRLKILSAQIKQNRLVLERVQLEGKTPSLFSQIKNLIRNPY